MLTRSRNSFLPKQELLQESPEYTAGHPHEVPSLLTCLSALWCWPLDEQTLG